MKCYTSITELPLSKFIEVYVDNNLYALVIEGEADLEKLNEAWNVIVEQYNAALGDEEQKMYQLLLADLTNLTIDYTIINELVQVLVLRYHKPFADEINSILRTSFAFNWDKPEQYREELKRCERRSNSIKTQIKLKQAEFDSIEKRVTDKNENPNSKPSREYFISVLINLSNHSKYQISENINVYEFCTRIRNLNEYLSSIKELTPK